ncbi:MAG: response regulator transcription factor [Alphaproteobacteria bacterium]|nr:MAG: response regulator transcription factor [Alphaproteobacteria bacterium]
MKKNILLVDDDDALRESLAEQLAMYDEFKVTQVSRAAQALEKVKEQEVPDLVILDVGLPDMDGRDTCRLMRRAGYKAPIIMLTGAATDADTILGLDAGANDYVAKPFRFNVLLARVRAQIRQNQNSEDAQVRIGKYLFQPSTKIMVNTQTDQKLKLTEKEAGIIRQLYKAGGRVVPREVLLNDIWGYNSGVSTHTLETHIYRLRQKIDDDKGEGAVIITEGGGYRIGV